MAVNFPQISDNFETASGDSTSELRAFHVLSSFTTGTLGKTFDAHEFEVNLSRSEKAGEFVMQIELLPDASDQNEYNLNELAIVLVENMVAIRHAVVEGSHEPFMLDIEPTKYGFTMMTPDLKDFTTLYARVSELRELNWYDAKFCAETGREYSLADLEQVIALAPKPDSEEPMDRPLDMGLPKPRLQ